MCHINKVKKTESDNVDIFENNIFSEKKFSVFVKKELKKCDDRKRIEKIKKLVQHANKQSITEENLMLIKSSRIRNSYVISNDINFISIHSALLTIYIFSDGILREILSKETDGETYIICILKRIIDIFKNLNFKDLGYQHIFYVAFCLPIASILILSLFVIFKNRKVMSREQAYEVLEGLFERKLNDCKNESSAIEMEFKQLRIQIIKIKNQND